MLIDLLRERNVPTAPGGHHHVTKGRVQIDCPVCTPGQRRWRLGIAETGRYASCWSCGRLPVVETLAAATGLPFGVVRERLKLLDTITPKRGPDLRGTLKVPKGVGPLLRAHRTYLERRRFDPDEVAEVWGVQGLGIAPKLQWRLFIPATLNGETVSWTTRALTDRTSARYISARPEDERLSLKSLLYGGDLTRHAVAVVEGPLDAWRIGPGAVATCGVVMSPEQELLIASYPLRVLCLDSDHAGQRKARRLMRKLGAFPGQTLNVVLESSKDAAGARHHEVRGVRKLLA
jgi:hypothetical protein